MSFSSSRRPDAMGLVKKCAREPILMTRKMREAAARERVRPTRAVIRFTAPPPSDLMVEASFGAEERVQGFVQFAGVRAVAGRGGIDRALRDASEARVEEKRRDDALGRGICARRARALAFEARRRPSRARRRLNPSFATI